MGREVRRVPLDFDWPLNKVWDGFVNPHYKKCPDCENGTTTGRDRLYDLVRLLMCSGTDAINGQCHPYFGSLTDNLLYSHYKIPSMDLAELTGGLAGRSQDRPFGHDACDEYKVMDKIIKAAGLDPKTWGICPTCKGESMDPAVKEEYEAWKPTPIPEGPGWQMWETTSEGSPISPVFDTPEKLARWLADTGAKTFGPMTTDYETWLKMIKGPGWAPSATMSPETGFISGVETAASWADKDE